MRYLLIQKIKGDACWCSDWKDHCRANNKETLNQKEFIEWLSSKSDEDLLYYYNDIRDTIIYLNIRLTKTL